MSEYYEEILPFVVFGKTLGASNAQIDHAFAVYSLYNTPAHNASEAYDKLLMSFNDAGVHLMHE